MSHLGKLWAAITAKPKLNQLQSFTCLLTFVLVTNGGVMLTALLVWLADKVHNMLAFVTALAGIVSSFGLGIWLSRQLYGHFATRNEQKKASL